MIFFNSFIYFFESESMNYLKYCCVFCFKFSIQTEKFGWKIRLKSTHPRSKSSNPCLDPPEHANHPYHPETVSHMTASRTAWRSLLSAFTNVDTSCWSLNQVAHPLCYTPFVTWDNRHSNEQVEPFLYL